MAKSDPGFQGKNIMRKSAARYPEIITDIYLCVITAVFPLWAGRGGYTDITEVKYGFFAVSGIVYISAMLIILAELFLIGEGRETAARLRRMSVTQICVIAYAVCCCISAVLSEYGDKVWAGAGRSEGLRTVLLYTGIFLVVSFFGKFRLRYAYLLGASVLANAAIASLQYMGFNPFHLFPAGYTFHDAYTLYTGAFLGTIGNVDIMSALLSLAVPLFFACYILYGRSRLLLLPFTAGVFLLLLSGASAGIVGTAAGLALVSPLIVNTKERFRRALTAAGLAFLAAAAFTCLGFTYEDRVTAAYFSFGAVPAALLLCSLALLGAGLWLKRRRGGRWDSGRLKRTLAVCVFSGLLALTAVIAFYPFKSGTLYEAHEILHGDIRPEFGSRRIQIWQEVIRLIKERPWFGGGPDTLAGRVTFSFRRYSAELGRTVETVIDTAHNDYLNIFVNTGVFSLLAYLAALGTAAARALRRPAGRASLAVGTALLCYLIQIFFSFSVCIVSPLFWAFFGLLEAGLGNNAVKE